jgi:hypothetical protein
MAQYCCIKMEGVLEEHNSPLQYKPQTRCYYMLYPSMRKPRKNDVFIAETLYYCSWCGIKLPESLKKEWSEIVREKFGITDTLDREQLRAIPQEYMTDEWWKKLGL